MDVKPPAPRPLPEAAQASAAATGVAPKKGSKKESKEGKEEGEGEDRALRKRFIAQHRKMLADLVNRNREEEARREEVSRSLGFSPSCVSSLLSPTSSSPHRPVPLCTGEGGRKGEESSG